MRHTRGGSDQKSVFSNILRDSHDNSLDMRELSSHANYY
jgi:hypothetical protein